KKTGGKNLDETKDHRFDKLMAFLKENGSGYVIVDAGIEQDLKDMSELEKTEMRSGLSTTGAVLENGIDNLIKKSYEILGLITYFTTGEDETRGWTIQKGWTAPLAGTAIHT